MPYGTIPKALVRVTVEAGNADDPAGQTWMADLTGDLLLEGTKTRSASRIAQDAAAMGGEVAVQAGENLTTIGGEVLSEFTPSDGRSRGRRGPKPRVSGNRASRA